MEPMIGFLSCMDTCNVVAVSGIALSPNIIYHRRGGEILFIGRLVFTVT